MKLSSELKDWQKIVFETNYDETEFAQKLQQQSDRAFLQEIREREYQALEIYCTFPSEDYILLDDEDEILSGDLVNEISPEEEEDLWTVISDPNSWTNREGYVVIRTKIKYKDPDSFDEMPPNYPGYIFGVKV